MECKFVIGQRVQCICDYWEWDMSDVGFRWREHTPRRPVVGGVYTIREMFTIPNGKIGLRFKELVNPRFVRVEGFWGTPTECGFPHQCFQPLQEKKTDISVFTEILGRVNRGERVVVDE